MNVAVDIVFGHSLDDSLGSLHVDILQAEVLGGIVAADEVIYDVGVSDTGLDGLGITQIVFEEDDTAEITGNLEMALGHLLTIGNDDLASLTCCMKVVDELKV